LTKFLALACVGTFALIAAGATVPTALFARNVDDRPARRVETRSADLMAVGIVHGDRMTIHLSRLIDNAPVRDAAVTVQLRGTIHAATAEADGSYTVQTKDLDLPGSASVIFQIARGDTRESLEGALQSADNATEPAEKNSARQLGWWILNFAVCIGFLMLISRRRKAASHD